MSAQAKAGSRPNAAALAALAAALGLSERATQEEGAAAPPEALREAAAALLGALEQGGAQAQAAPPARSPPADAGQPRPSGPPASLPAAVLPEHPLVGAAVIASLETAQARALLRRLPGPVARRIVTAQARLSAVPPLRHAPGGDGAARLRAAFLRAGGLERRA